MNTDHNTDSDTPNTADSDTASPTITTPRPRRSRRANLKARAALGVVALSAIIGAGLMASAPPASATTLYPTPTYDCFTGSITVNKLPVVMDGRTSEWFPVIYQWDGTQWNQYLGGRIEVFQDTPFGTLNTNMRQSFQVDEGYYYMVQIVAWSTGDAGLEYYSALTGRAGWGRAAFGSEYCSA